MIDIDPILKTALQTGTGDPIVRLFGIYENELPAISPRTYLYPYKFKMTRTKLSAYFQDNLPYHYSTDAENLTARYVLILERGLRIGSTDYVVQSPFWYPSRISVDRYTRQSRIDCQAWNTSNYLKTTSAAATAQTVIENLMSTYSTASFLSQDWKDYQFDKPGATLRMSQFESLLPMLWNRYTVKMFPRQGGYVQFKSKILDGEDTPTSISFSSVNTSESDIHHTDYIDPGDYWDTSINKQWNLFWEDETGASHRLSATYPALVNFPIRNIGFLPSTANMPYIKRLLSDHSIDMTSPYDDETPRPAKWIIRPNLALEQGEFLTTTQYHINSAFAPVFADITEEFNMPGTTYPWQMTIRNEQMFYGIHTSQ